MARSRTLDSPGMSRYPARDGPRHRGAKRRGGGRELDTLIQKADVVVVPVDAEHVSEARLAYRRFGKGRHAAGLNFGDVFAYALARTAGERLLFKGEDFARTDIGRVI